MAVTDLTGTTWILNDAITFSASLGLSNVISFNFISNNISFYGFYFDFNSDGDNSLGYRTNQAYSYVEIYNSSGNIIAGKEAYKIVTITGGTDVTNSALISWFESNATQQTVSTKVSVDLTTLSGWESLSTGSHNITIVAKADGYRDSEPSAAVSVEKAAEEYTDCITFTGETSDFTLKATNKEWDGTVEYSTDHNTWTVWDGTAISSSNQKLYLRGSGNTKFFTKTTKGVRFVLSARAGCSGNVNTLLEHSAPPTTLSTRSCYRMLFYGCTNLTTAPALPATTLAANCYYQMFNDCTSLTTAPALPATTLAEGCYMSMFTNCTSLTTAPALPATTLATSCCNYMFQGCTSFKVSKTQTGTYQHAWRIPSSGTISSTVSGFSYYMLSNTGGTFTSDPSINTTYYVENEPV